ncbi:Mor transcription activator domain protein [Candidatus Magnetomorum sp. HK-1]|nr:Mor transcription activator domain protein [Candidatus Magnetomorum sp. HK-1]
MLELLEKDLPTEMKEMSNLIGFEAVSTLIKKYDGKRKYIPTYESILRPARDKAVKKEFDGSNVRQLARKYRLTTTYIIKILKKA